MNKDSLDADTLKQKLIVNRVLQNVAPLEQGLYNTVTTEPMSLEASKAFIDKLMPQVDFKGVNIGALARNEKAIDQVLGPMIQRAIIHDFGKPITDDSMLSKNSLRSTANMGYSLDETKLTPENIKAFGADVSNKVANYSQQLALAEKTFKLCEDKGMKFSPEQQERIMKNLAPTLDSFGSDYVEKNADLLANDLASKLKKNRSLLSRITGKASISDAKLGKITAQISWDYTPKAEKASVAAFQEQRMNNSSMTTVDFNAKVQYFAQRHGVMGDVSKMSQEEIGQIRLKNPKAFDETVFTKETQSPTPPVVEKVMKSPKIAQARAEFAQGQGTPTPPRPAPPPLPPKPEFLGLKEYQAANRKAAAANQAVPNPDTGQITTPKSTPRVKSTLVHNHRNSYKGADKEGGRGV